MKLRTIVLLSALLPGAAFAYDYKLWGGTTHTSAGPGAPGISDIAWMTQYTVTGGNSIITAVQLAFGSNTSGETGLSGLSTGTPFQVYVWSGTPTGAGADAPTLLATVNGTVAAGIIDTANLQTVAVNASITGTSNFFVGASVNAAQGTFPASQQINAETGFPILGNSHWFAWGTGADSFTPGNFSGMNLNTTNGHQIPGNWIMTVQASPVPEPATMATLAAALGALALRRRKRA